MFGEESAVKSCDQVKKSKGFSLLSLGIAGSSAAQATASLNYLLGKSFRAKYCRRTINFDLKETFVPSPIIVLSTKGGEFLMVFSKFSMLSSSFNDSDLL